MIFDVNKKRNFHHRNFTEPFKYMFNRSFFSNLPPVTKNLLIINVIIWAFIAITPAATTNKILELGALHYVTSKVFGVWQFFTYMFIHKDFWHLFFNMWALLMFGYAVEQRLGSKRFLFYYISCGLGAAIVQTIVFAVAIYNVQRGLTPAEYSFVLDNGWNIIQTGLSARPLSDAMQNLILLINMPVIGASGAVFGILLAMGMYFPNATMYLMFVPYPIKAKWIVIGYGVIELVMGIGSPGDGIAHFAHLGGMLFGFLMIWYWKMKEKKGQGFNG